MHCSTVSFCSLEQRARALSLPLPHPSLPHHLHVIPVWGMPVCVVVITNDKKKSAHNMLLKINSVSYSIGDTLYLVNILIYKFDCRRNILSSSKNANRFALWTFIMQTAIFIFSQSASSHPFCPWLLQFSVVDSKLQGPETLEGHVVCLGELSSNLTCLHRDLLLWLVLEPRVCNSCFLLF